MCINNCLLFTYYILFTCYVCIKDRRLSFPGATLSCTRINKIYNQNLDSCTISFSSRLYLLGEVVPALVRAVMAGMGTALHPVQKCKL